MSATQKNFGRSIVTCLSCEEDEIFVPGKENICPSCGAEDCLVWFDAEDECHLRRDEIRRNEVHIPFVRWMVMTRYPAFRDAALAEYNADAEDFTSGSFGVEGVWDDFKELLKADQRQKRIIRKAISYEVNF